MLIKNLRTIRRFQTLVNSDVTDVTMYNFRSLKEVETYADELMKEAKQDIADIKAFKKLFEPASLKSIMRVQTVASGIKSMRVIKKGGDITPTAPKTKVKEGEAIPVEFVAPPGQALVKKYAALDRLHKKIETLDSVIYRIADDFSDDPSMTGKLTKDLKAKRALLQKALVDAYAFLSTTAKKTEPKQFKLMVKHLVAKFVETFKDSFDDYKEYVYVTPKVDVKGKMSFEYNHYLELDNFTDDTDTIKSKYYVVFTGVISDNKLTMYFSTLTSYAPPGRFKPEHMFTKEANGWRDLQISLEAENFSTYIERVPLEVTTPQLKKIKWGVPSDMIQGIGVEENVIQFGLNGKLVRDRQSAINIADVLNRELILKIMPAAKGHIGRRVYKQKGSKNWMVDLVVLKPSHQHIKDIRVDQKLVDRLMTEFNWDGNKATQFVRQFNKMVSEDFDDSEAKPDPKALPIKVMKTLKPKEEPADPGVVKKITEIVTAVLTAVGINFKLMGVDKVVTPTVVPNVTKERIAAALGTRVKGSGLKVHTIRVEPELVTLIFENLKGGAGGKKFIVKIGDGIPLKVS